MSGTLIKARSRARKTIDVIQWVFAWWVVAPVVWLSVLIVLRQEGLSWLTAIAAALVWALPVGLVASLAVHLVSLGLIKLIADDVEPCVRCGSRRTNGNYCGDCGARLTTSTPLQQTHQSRRQT
jgi:hypothetical protein